MMARSLILCCFLTIPFSLSAFTLTEALAKVARHPALEVERLEKKRVEVQGSDLGRCPGDSLELEVENLSGSRPGWREAEVKLTWRRPLLDRAKVRSERNALGVALRENDWELERRRWEISSDVQRAFHRCLVASLLADSARQREDIMRAMMDAARARFESGAGPEREVLKARLEVQRCELERRQLEGSLVEARLTVFRELGVEASSGGNPVGTLTPDLVLPELPRLVEGMEAIHPELARIRLQVSRSQAEEAVLSGKNRADWSMMAGVAGSREPQEQALLIGIEAGLPNPRANSGARKAFGIEREKLERQREVLRRAAGQRLEELAVCFDNSRQNALELRDRIVPGAEEVLRLCLDAYQLGKSDQMVILEAQKTLAESRQEYFKALGELYQAADEIEKMCGLCLVGEQHGE